MLISDKQHQANRQNAQHSTGPKTAAGKTAVKFNAFTYGLRARTLMLATEDFERYNELWAGFEAEWQPQTPTERFYLETMAASHWLLARADESEQRIYRTEMRLESESALLDRVAAPRTRLERSFTAALRELKQLQKDRQARQPRPVQEVQPAQTVQPEMPASQPVHQPAQPQAPPPDHMPPDYLMSNNIDPCPVSCAPAPADTR